MPRVALAAFLLAGILASVAAAVGAQSKGEWGAKAPALLKRTEVAVAAGRGKVYVGGGFQQGLSLITPTVEEDDTATDTWPHHASLPHRDRNSTPLNSTHARSSPYVFCLRQK